MKLYNFLLLSIFVINPVFGQEASAPKPGIQVIVSVVESKEFADKIEALGTLRANDSVELTSSVTEVVTSITFLDNQRVKQGDVLVEMDTSEEFAELAEQKAFAGEALRQINRLIPLVEQRAASASLLDESRSELEAANARIRAIESRIAQRIVKAPFDGVLGLKNISIGTLAQPGSIITTIDDDRVMKLDFSVPEVFLASLKPGVVIEAQTEAYENTIFKGTIAFVNSRIDPVTRSIQARALLNNDLPNQMLKPGLLMQVELQKNPRTAILIPEESVVANGPENYVFVALVKNGKTLAEQRLIQIGSRQYGEVEIISGLNLNEKIITHGTLKVRDGSELSITAVESGNDSLEELLTKGQQNNKKSNEDI